jgi:hypothetical protein
MKLSIWQQWASNHSASFYVVGKFADVESAREAKERVAKLVQDIAHYLSDPAHSEKFTESGMAPTPPEVSLSDELGIEWQEHSIESGIRVSVFENCVGITNSATSWQSPDVFERLLKKLGAETLGEYGSEIFPDEPIFVNMCCKPRDVNALFQLKTEIEDHFAALKQFQDTIDESSRSRLEQAYTSPWHSYSTYQATYLHELLTHGKGGVVRSGKGDELLFRQWRFGDLSIGLQAFVDYLRAKDCTEIRIEIGQFQWKTLLDEEV